MITSDFYKKLKNIRGVYSRDSLPKKIKNKECGIINLDTSDGPGTHWTCYYNDPFLDFVEYFDSFGFSPPEEVKKYLRSGGKEDRYNDTQFQMIDSIKCGYYCVKYIREREKGKSPIHVLYSFKQKPSRYNENLV